MAITHTMSAGSVDLRNEQEQIIVARKILTRHVYYLSLTLSPSYHPPFFIPLSPSLPYMKYLFTVTITAYCFYAGLRYLLMKTCLPFLLSCGWQWWVGPALPWSHYWWITEVLHSFQAAVLHHSSTCVLKAGLLENGMLTCMYSMSDL